MAITAAGRARHETITLRHGDEEGQVTINPSAMTTAVQIELQEIVDAAEQTRFLIDILCDLIIEWEIEDDNGDPLPITEESMLALESRLVWSIYTAIREAREEEGKRLRMWLVSEGLDGSCPQWYPLMRAARYLGVAPWELENQPSYWADRATAAETAESRQAAAAQRRAQRR